MQDRQENSVDEGQVKITLPVTIAFSVGLAMIVGTGLASYFGNRLAIEKDFSSLRERMTKVEAATAELSGLSQKVNKSSDDMASVRQGVWILLHDRGYDADKILSQNHE